MSNLSTIIPKNTSHYLRLNRSHINIEQMLEDEYENSLLHNNANKIKHYDISYDLKPPKSRYRSLEAIPFNSIHKLTESRIKNQLEEILRKPQRTPLELQVLKKIERKQGKLLSQIDSQFNNEILQQSTDLTYIPKHKAQFKLPSIKSKKTTSNSEEYSHEEDEKSVEDLDHWLVEKVKIRKPAAQEDYGDSYSFSTSPIAKRPVPKRPSHKKSTSITTGICSKELPKSKFSVVEKSGIDECETHVEFDDPSKQLLHFSLAQDLYNKEDNDTYLTSVDKKDIDAENNIEQSQNEDSASSAFITINTKEHLSSSHAPTKCSVAPVVLKTAIIEQTGFYERNNNDTYERLLSTINEAELFINTRQANMQMCIVENSGLNKKMDSIHRHVTYFASDFSKIAQFKLQIELDNSSKKKNAKKEFKHLGHPKNIDIQEIGHSLEEIVMHDNLQAHKDKIARNNATIQELEEEIQNKKVELKNAIASRKKFLINTLEKGLDVREQGLIWIMKALWSLDVHISSDDLPTFLDTKSKSYLLSRARMEYELSELRALSQNIIQIYHASTKENISNDQVVFSSVFKTENFDNSFVSKSSSKKSLLNASIQPHKNIFSPLDESLHLGSPTSLNFPSPSKKSYKSHFTQAILSRDALNSYELDVPKNNMSFGNETLNLLNPDIDYDTNNKSSISYIQSISSVSSDNDENSMKGYDKQPHGDDEGNDNVFVTDQRSVGIDSLVKGPKICSQKNASSSLELPRLRVHEMPSLISPLGRISISNHSNPQDSLNNSKVHDEMDLIGKLYHPARHLAPPKSKFTNNEKMYKLARGSIFKLIEKSEKKSIIEDDESLDQSLKVYNGLVLLNDYESKAQFVEKLSSIQKRIDILVSTLKQEENNETARIIKQFQTHNYKKRFNTEPTIVLPALFGSIRGEKILSKYGYLQSNAKK